MTVDKAKACINELERIHEDSQFSAQSYFEAAKSANFWGKSIVFIPAVAAAVASLLVSIGGPKEWGAVGAIAGAVAATSSFLGSTRSADSHLECAREFTRIRHSARMEISLAKGDGRERELEPKLRSLRSEYDRVVQASSPIPNRIFRRAQRRIRRGTISYQQEQ